MQEMRSKTEIRFISLMLALFIAVGMLPINAAALDKTGQHVLETEQVQAPTMPKDGTAEDELLPPSQAEGEGQTEAPYEQAGEEAQQENPPQQDGESGSPKMPQEQVEEPTPEDVTPVMEVNSLMTATSSLDGGWIGSGTAADPWQISSVADLQKLAELNNSLATTSNPGPYSGYYFLQTSDIDLSGINNWRAIAAWWIDTQRRQYVFWGGNYNGGGHQITNMKITSVDTDRNDVYASLFGRVDGGAVIRNLGVSGSVDVSNANEVGGIVSTIASYGSDFDLPKGATIVNCYSNVNVVCRSDATYTSAGVFAGRADIGAKIVNCYSYGSAATPNKAERSGLFIGYCDERSSGSQILDHCYFANDISNPLGNAATTAVGATGGSSTVMDEVLGKTTAAMKQEAFAALLNDNRAGAAQLCGITEEALYSWKSVSGELPTLVETVDPDLSGYETIADMEIAFASLTEAKNSLPQKVKAILSTGSEVTLDIEWTANKTDLSDLEVCSSKGREYRFEGTVNLAAAGIRNPQNIASPSVKIVQTNGWLGSGTPEDPWQITSVQDLQLLSELNNGLAKIGTPGVYTGYYFLQTADLDLSSIDNWRAIAARWQDLEPEDDYTYFGGNYNGGGHEVTNMMIRTLDSSKHDVYASLFGRLDGGAVIRNLGVSGTVDVENGNEVGGIASLVSGIGTQYGAPADAATIINCYSNATAITRSNTWSTMAGVFIGRADGKTKIINCYSYGKAATPNLGRSQAGLFIGTAYKNGAVTLDHCYFASDVSNTEDYAATQACGHIGSGASIDEKEVVMKTTSEMRTSTFAALLNANRNGAAQVSGMAESALYNWQQSQGQLPKLIASVDPELESYEPVAVISEKFASVEEAKKFLPSSIKANLKTGEQISVNVTWSISEAISKTPNIVVCSSKNVEYVFNGEPALSAAGIMNPDSVLCPDAVVQQTQGWLGAGTSEDPWQISSVADLQLLSELNNGLAEIGMPGVYTGYYFLQTSDLDLSGISNWRAIAARWEDLDPVDDFTYFGGNYNGGGHEIVNMTIRELDSSKNDVYASLFGRLDGGAVIRNLGVSGTVDVTNGNEVGGIASLVSSVGTQYGAPGDAATIINCYSNAIAISRSNNWSTMAGVFIGRADSKTKIINCYSYGKAATPNAGENRAGLFIGTAYRQGVVTLDHCYFAVDIENTEVNAATKACGTTGDGASLSENEVLGMQEANMRLPSFARTLDSNRYAAAGSIGMITAALYNWVTKEAGQLPKLIPSVDPIVDGYDPLLKTEIIGAFSTLAEAIALLPATVTVHIKGTAETVETPIIWSTEEVIRDGVDSYVFTGKPNLAASGLLNSDNVKFDLNITLRKIGDNSFQSDLYMPTTSLISPPTIVLNHGTDVPAIAGQTMRPQQAIWYLSYNPGIDAIEVRTNEAGASGGDLNMVLDTALRILPVFYLSDETTATKLVEAIRQYPTLQDATVCSADPAIVKLVCDATQYMRGMVDYRTSELSAIEMKNEANQNHAKLLLLSEEQATVENIRKLQTLLMTVWVDTDVESMYTMTMRGVDGIVTTDHAQATRVIESFAGTPVANKQPVIIAHRGIHSTGLPENSAIAVRKAAELGMSGAEIDIRLTSDGEIVSIHNANTSGLFNQNLTISSSTLAQLKTLHYNGSAEKIATLNELLDILKEYPNFHLVIEIKSGEAALITKLRSLLDQYDVYGQVDVISFDTTQLARMYQTIPEISIANLNGYGKAPGSISEATAVLKTVYKQLQPINAAYNPNNSYVNLTFMKVAHVRGLATIPWTIQNVELDNAYLNGFTAMTTDSPANYTDVPVQILSSSGGKVFRRDNITLKAQSVNRKGDKLNFSDYALFAINGPVLTELGNGKYSTSQTGVSTLLLGKRLTTPSSGASYLMYSEPFSIEIRNPEVLTGTVAIQGEHRYGETLKADNTQIQPQNATYTYAWYREDSSVPLVTDADYKLTVDDVGKTITLRVEGSELFMGQISASTAKIEKLVAPDAPSGLLGVTPTTVANVNGQITGLDARKRYEYKLADASAYTMVLANSSRITNLVPGLYLVRLQATDTTNASKEAYVVVSAFEATQVSGAVKIDGSPRIGSILTINTDGIRPQNATYDYFWYRQGVSEAVATNKPYTLTEADLGKTITLRVLGNLNYTGELTAETGPVGNAGVSVTGSASFNAGSVPQLEALFSTEGLAIDAATTGERAASGAYQLTRTAVKSESENSVTFAITKTGEGKAAVSVKLTDAGADKSADLSGVGIVFKAESLVSQQYDFELTVVPEGIYTVETYKKNHTVATMTGVAITDANASLNQLMEMLAGDVDANGDVSFGDYSALMDVYDSVAPEMDLDDVESISFADYSVLMDQYSAEKHIYQWSAS